ncbi:MAG: fibronectin type III domain-containing protein, partial [Firmicutes bacterium]|nr:fibronectin type III domain-containing protein [Bacillota bacterium]
INPKGATIKKPSASKKAFTAKWKKQSSKMPKARVTGYQIRYSTSPAFPSGGTKIKTVKKYTKTSCKIKKLSKKTRYYVQVRTYMKTSGGTFYSTWSAAKSVVTK